jgi:signal recognition particle receptor subunit alpha
MRKWNADGQADEDDEMDLDFSKPEENAGGSGALEAVDQSSWGTRTADGQFMLKDIGDEMNDILSEAKSKTSDTQAPSGIVGSSLGAIGGLFRNVVGGKTLTKEDLAKALKGMEDHLMKKNVAREAALRLCDSVERDLLGLKTGSFTSMQLNHTLSFLQI